MCACTETEIEALLATAVKLLEETDLKGDDGARFELGQMLEYNSVTQGGWVLCQVVDIKDCKIKIDLKDGHYFSLKEQETRFRARDLKEPYPVGTALEYNSVSQGQWVPCEVVEVRPQDRAVMIDIKKNYWFPLVEQGKWFRPPVFKPYEVGDHLEYNSKSQGSWVPCLVVEQREKDKAIAIDIKAGHWFTLHEQQELFRQPCACLFQEGQLLEYMSKSLGRWVPCTVLAVDGDGDMQVNVKKDYWFDLEEQRTMFRVFDREGPLLSGWLHKRGPILGFEWRRRWCVLTAHALKDFRDETCDELMDTVDFGRFTWACPLTDAEAPGEAVKHKAEKPFGFVLDADCYGGKKRKLDYFDAGDEPTMSLWLEKIEQAAELKREFLLASKDYVSRLVVDVARRLFEESEGEEEV